MLVYNNAKNFALRERYAKARTGNARCRLTAFQKDKIQFIFFFLSFQDLTRGKVGAEVAVAALIEFNLVG